MQIILGLLFDPRKSFELCSNKEAWKKKVFSPERRRHKEQSVSWSDGQAFIAGLFIRHLITTQKTDNNAAQEASPLHLMRL